ncbi:hypothetical protein F4801DRAFT_565383 [Xylaria longipes]|nr:hypothetical protein F4801DRAFT_565383 [Xylaria longipes]
MPEYPLDLKEPPTDPKTLGSKIETYLQQFRPEDRSPTLSNYPMLKKKERTLPYVHPRFISFHSEQNKVN